MTLPKKGNLQQCQNYRTISLISHPSKVMLKTILNRLKPQPEKIIAEEQADFRAGRSTTEQIFNLRILCEKYLWHQQDLYHVFIDFKKAFNRVWHAALWATMKKYNISTNHIQVIKKTKKQTHTQKNYITRPLVPSSSTAAKETGSEQQLDSDRDAFCHPLSSTYFWKISCQTP